MINSKKKITIIRTKHEKGCNFTELFTLKKKLGTAEKHS